MAGPPSHGAGQPPTELKPAEPEVLPEQQPERPGAPPETRLPIVFAVVVVALSLAPLAVSFAGFDLSSSAATGPYAHFILEWTAFCTAVLAGLLAFGHYQVKHSAVTPILGVALLCSGVLDGFHALAATRLLEGIATPEQLLPFTWTAGRMLNALLLSLAVAIAVVARPQRRRWGLGTVVVAAALGSLLAFVIVRAAAGSETLPTVVFPDAVVPRPWDLLPLALVLLVAFPLLRMHDRRDPSLFVHSLQLSLIPLALAQVHAAFGSTLLHDSHFNAAHLLKILAYAVPFAGLALDYVVSRDEAVRTREEERLRSQQRYENLVNDVDGIVWEAATNPFRFTFVSSQAERLLGYPLEMWYDPTFWPARLHPDDRDATMAANKAAIAEQRDHELEYRMITADDGEVWLRDLVSACTSEDGSVMLRGVMVDVTARRLAEERLLHHARHDVLTGLPNRHDFADQLAGAIGRARRRDDYVFAVLVLDLDRFQVVNDSLGHGLGDDLLVETAGRLRSLVREGDVVARLGGDEFAILLDDIDSEDRGHQFAERIHQRMKDPFHLEGHDIFTTASIGITQSSVGYTHPEEVIRDADTALNRSKSKGRGRHEIFDPHMRVKAVTRLRLETDLRRAIEREEFILHYQPLITLGDGQIAGFEALVRWVHPDRGLLLPAEFIPLAEDTDLILPLGEWTLNEACRQAKQWQVSFPRSPPLAVSVNLSGRQFSQPEIVEIVAGAVQETGLPSSSLKLEITESVILDDSEAVSGRLSALRALDVQLQVDDFGTGYSSLSYIQRFPINSFKIDQSFVRRMTEDEENAEIVRAIVSLARNLGLDVTAEGVEKREQLVQLRELGCKYAQGFYFSKPLSADAAAALLASPPHWLSST